MASFVCPPPSSSLPPTPPHLLGRRRRRRSTARGAPPSLPSSITGDSPPSPGRPSFLFSRSRFTRAPPPLLRPSSGGTPDHLDLAGIELDRIRGAEVLLRRLTLLPGGEAPCALAAARPCPGGRARVAPRLPLPLPSGGGASPVELVAARLELELRPGGGISGRPRSLPIPALPPDPARVDGAGGGPRVEQAAERERLRAGRAGGSRRAQQARMAARARRRARRASTPVPRCLPPHSLFSGRLELGRLKVGAADLAGQRGRSERPPVD